MKQHSAELEALLISGDYVYANCFQITLRSGVRILWTDAELPVRLNADLYATGPLISVDGFNEQIGLNTSTFTITLETDGADNINGVLVIPYICQGGFFNANITVYRAFAPTWAAMFVAPTGFIIRGNGRMGEITSAGGTVIEFDVDSWTILLDAQMPRNIVQPFCAHNLYDSGCGISKASRAVGGTVSGDNVTTQFNSTLIEDGGYFNLGFVIFNTGPCAGQQSTVRSYYSTASGPSMGSTFIFVRPWPVAPNVGDAFTAYPGCDLLYTTCRDKFANLLNFKGEPFVPAAETSA